MRSATPHYLLFSQAAGSDARSDRWRFVLQPVGGRSRLVAADAEPGAEHGRLELLAVVRGLEALDQPSRVTLLTRSRYVSRGIIRGLSQWRERHWQWERFGKLVPIRDHDLWRRVDRALHIHEVECCAWQWESGAETTETSSEAAPAAATTPAVARASGAAIIVEEPSDPAVLIVRRRNGIGTGSRQRSTVSRWLGDWVQAIRTAVWRPAFTRAA
jgi:ribonuclease HI